MSGRENIQSRFFSQFANLPFDHKWKDVITIINGKAYGEEYKVSGAYPICGSGGIMGYGEKKMCDRDSIILGRKGNIDKPIYMSEDYWIVDTAFCLSPNTELIHPVYLYYWCKQFDFQKLNKQAVLPSLTRSDLEQIDIQVPKMAEQLAFVEIVQQADKSKFIGFKSRFIEMFGDLSRKPLLDIATSWDKGQPFKKDSIIENGARPCIHYGELYKYGPIIDTVVSLTNEVAIKKSKTGDILFPASDVTPYGLARCSALMIEGVLLGGDIIVLRISKDNSPEYVSYAINMQQDQLIRRVTGSVVRHMSAKSLKTVDIPIPSLDAQLQFVSLIRQADKSKYLN